MANDVCHNMLAMCVLMCVCVYACVCVSGIGFGKDNCVKHLARMATYVVNSNVNVDVVVVVVVTVVIIIVVGVLGTLATFTRRSNFKQQTTSFPLISRCQALLLLLSSPLLPLHRSVPRIESPFPAWRH